MKALNILIVLIFGVLYSSCSSDELVDIDNSEFNFGLNSELDLRGDGECCDFTYDIVSQNISGDCCFYELRVTNTGDCPITISDTKDILTIGPGETHTIFYRACDIDDVPFTGLTVTSIQGEERVQCGTIPLTTDCSEPCTCDVTINKDGCTLSSEIGDHCQRGPNFSFAWTYPSGATSDHWAITARYTGEYCLTITDENGCTAEDCIFVDDCEEPTCDDCVFTISTEDQGKDVQYTDGLQVAHGCNGSQFSRFCGNGGAPVIIKNDSGCSDDRVIQVWNSYPNNTPGLNYPASNLSALESCMEATLQSIAGCGNTSVSVVSNNQGGLDYTFQYDCETCEITFIRALERAFDVNDDCDEIEFPTSSEFTGGFTNCGACE